MFRRSTIQLLVLLLVLALATRATLLALFSVLLLLTAGVAWLWNRYALARVEYTRAFSTTRAFPGDQVELTVTLTNRKPLPLPQISLRDSLPNGIEIDSDDVRFDQHDRQALQRSTSMRWYERITWRYQATCLRRGAYRVGPAQLDGGDPFGFFRTTADVPRGESLIVYPLPLPLAELGLPARNPLGALRAHTLIRDPLLTVGVRDYHPDDPIRDVHWGATARTGSLQTRIYEPTTARELAIVLDLDSFEQYWQGVDENQTERLISAAATLAKLGLEGGYAVGLFVNGAPAQFEQLVRLPPGRNPAQLGRIMETLARLTPYSVTQVARVLRMAAADLPWGATILLVSAIQPRASLAELARLRERGRAVAWLYLGEDAAPKLPGVPVHHAPPVGDWRR
ncbi:MAG: DUF58 domain-containing protein [Roseiflexaceae bacterium]|nr:DUF58 domain-containing protein [Roseiflexaceae bacterium]